MIVRVKSKLIAGLNGADENSSFVGQEDIVLLVGINRLLIVGEVVGDGVQSKHVGGDTGISKKVVVVLKEAPFRL